ncbi:BamA/TamA family outer membrane protein [Jiulongibacter sediminis]|uniref:translocation and assembly module lipoprotein TamL n=1 Tax=Jiulongibacter sediminis TaxID=1605367 RepID=UPI0026F37683|nr:BamA/TamA family outer membrane protein [Jiulongibacter sediminis]
MKTSINYILLLAFSITAFSCSRQIQLKENEYLLAEQDFSGNSAIHSEDLADLIPLEQRPNSKPLNLPFIQFTPRVWMYNFGLNTYDSTKQAQKLLNAESQLAQYPTEYTGNQKTERAKTKLKRKTSRLEENIEKENGWFWRNIGEPQTVLSEEDMKETSGRIERYLKDIGYRDASVAYDLDTLITTEKYKLTYEIKEGRGYRIDTVFYDIPDRKLDSLITAHKDERRIKAGDLFDIRKVQAEKARLELLAKENGYFEFLSQYIEHEAFNYSYDFKKFEEEKHGNLRITVLNPPGNARHASYRVSQVIFKGFDPYNTDVNVSADTTVINDVKYITLNKSLNERLLDNKVTTRPGELYDVSSVSETQRQIGLLNQFSFASSQVFPINDDEVTLEYFAPQMPKYSFSTGPGLNHVYNSGSSFLGFGVPVTLTARNWTKRLELFEASGRIFREGQPSPLGTTDVRGSWEIGTNLSVTYPNISFFGKDIEKLKLKNPRSQFGAGFNYSEPFWGNRLNFRLTSTYRWQPSRHTTIILSPLDANLINTNYNLNDPAGKSFYDELVNQANLGNNIKTTFDPQFVSSINGSYVYNDQNLQEPYGSSKFLRISIESGGTLLNLSQNKDQIGFIEKLFPLRSDFNSPDTVRKYFRFIKFNVDYRRYVNLAPSSSFAYRLNFGVANPYGNKSLPYEKNFFVGGSNSVRAWSPRALGVGSAFPDTASGNIIPQAGDILLEGSLEVRKKVARFFGDIQLAAFVDAGNIWKWHQINTPAKFDKANFDFKRFYKEFAVGTGFGIRYDLSYFQFRFDWGIKVMDPSRDEGDRFVLDEFRFKRQITNTEGNMVNNPYRLNFNLGIGYPF